MNIHKTALIFMLTAASVSNAMASNDMILLNPSDFSQLAVLDINGNNNRLVISQTGPAGQQGNVVKVSIGGNANGGPLGASFTGAAATLGIAAGSIDSEWFQQ